MFAFAFFQLKVPNNVLFALELLREIEQNEIVENMGSISYSHYNFRDGFFCNTSKSTLIYKQFERKYIK